MLAALIFRQIETQIASQTAWRLHTESKTAGMAIHERLVTLQGSMASLAALAPPRGRPGAALPPAPALANIRSALVGVSYNTRPGRLIPALGRAAPALTPAQRRHLAAGKDLLDTLAGKNGRPVILLRRLIKPNAPKAGLVAAVLDPARLLAHEAADSGILSVVDAGGRLLFSSEPVPARIAARPMKAESGEFMWRRKGISYRAGYWNLFLMPDFLAPRWTIITSMRHSEAVAPLSRFRSIFPPVIAFSLFVVSLLSIIQIRRHLVPLERLREAAVKVGERDFSNAAVSIRSGDEFEELANAFNTMATRLDRQFRALSAMAELDRSILSALDADYIIETLLRRMPDVVACDFVLLAVFDRHDGVTARLRITRGHDHAEPLRHSVALTPRDIQALQANRVLSVDAGRDELPAYLLSLHDQGAAHFLLFPIELQQEVAGVMGLAYRQPHDLQPEDIEQTRELAGRIAVALSNAAWEEKLYHHAHYDTLTNLPNRLLLKDRLEQAMARAGRTGNTVAILFIDLDRFKDVNDSLGHRAGDELLVLVAQALHECIRATDTVVRLGGDEFTVIIPDIDRQDDAFSTVDAVAKQIHATLSRPFRVGGHEIRVTASMGIAFYPRDADNYDDMLRKADSAMYHAKGRGKSNYQFYSDKLNARTLERLQTENGLRRALEGGQLRLYYQPQICTATGRIVGAEALLRWQLPDGRIVAPAQFISVAEDTGLIVPIGEWVLNSACQQAVDWRKQGLAGIKIAVNISARQFIQTDLIDQVARALTHSTLDPRYLELEITESTTMDSAENAVATLHRLKELGVHLSIDDFGTGYSSLNYLKRFPIDYLKIDQTFVYPLPGDPESMCIVDAVIALAHGLKLTVIAEGVETAEQYDLLQARGCQVLQGYFISKPLPADEFAARFLRDEASVT